jgi:uncharacterized protein (DUF2141 family)
MKILFVILIFLATLILSSEDKFTPYGTLEVSVVDIRSNKGNIFMHLYYEKFGNNIEDFPTKSSKAFKMQLIKSEEGENKFIFHNIPLGRYAITTHHDENMNGKMDRNLLGFPAEPWGLSNNPKVLFSVPDFDECSFEISQGKTETTIIINN